MGLPRLRAVTPVCAKPRPLKPCGGKSPRLRQPLRRAGTLSVLAMTSVVKPKMDGKATAVGRVEGSCCDSSNNGLA